MRLRPLLLAATAAAALAGAVPAEAAAYPVCATALTLAATGTSASCSTNPLPVANGGAQRIFTVEVASGSVDVVARCGQYGVRTAHVSGPRPVVLTLIENGHSCSVTVTAADYDTTAVATSTFAYVLHS